jgi:outer membrane receptor protein involved in Fe transport
VTCDATGHRLPFAPEFKLDLGANREVFLGRLGILVLGGAAAYNSGYYSDPDNVVRQKAFVTFDASIEWRPAGHGLSFRLWALNLTDTHYYDSLTTFPTASVLYRPAAPRRVGASVAEAF